MGLRFSKLETARICNSCASVAKYELRAGVHNLILCPNCVKELQGLIKTGTECADIKIVEYDHMQEVSHERNG